MRFRTDDKGFITLRFADFPNTEYDLVGDGSGELRFLRVGADAKAAALTEATFELEQTVGALEWLIDKLRAAEERERQLRAPEQLAG